MGQYFQASGVWGGGGGGGHGPSSALAARATAAVCWPLLLLAGGCCRHAPAANGVCRPPFCPPPADPGRLPRLLWRPRGHRQDRHRHPGQQVLLAGGAGGAGLGWGSTGLTVGQHRRPPRRASALAGSAGWGCSCGPASGAHYGGTAQRGLLLRCAAHKGWLCRWPVAGGPCRPRSGARAPVHARGCLQPQLAQPRAHQRFPRPPPHPASLPAGAAAGKRRAEKGYRGARQDPGGGGGGGAWNAARRAGGQSDAVPGHG